MIPEGSRKHPWGGFLHHRMIAINWMKNVQGYSDTEIARTLSMDELQVWLIRTNPLNREIFDDIKS